MQHYVGAYAVGHHPKKNSDVLLLSIVGNECQRERERERDRQTDRQRGGEREKGREGKSDRQTDL